MFEPLSNLIENSCRVHDFDNDKILSTDYYLTTPTFENNYTVKLGVKIVLVNGESYGNIVQIPFNTLDEFVQRERKCLSA